MNNIKIILTEYKHKVLTMTLNNGNPEYVSFSPIAGSVVGNIYVGRVMKVVKNLKACFVEIAPGRSVFLKESECIDRRLPVQGDMIPVRLITEPIKTKESSASMHLQVSGKYLVISDSGVNGVSKKITLKKERNRLLSVIDSAKSELINAGDAIASDIKDYYGNSVRAGVTVRTVAEHVAEEELIAEFNTLYKMFCDIYAYSSMRTMYSLLYSEREEYIRYINSIKPEEIEEVVTDIPRLYEQLKSESVNVRLYDDKRVSLINAFSLQNKLDALTGNRAYLSCGGYLVIEQTEALNVIDVNSGKYDKKKSTDEYVMKVNTEAAYEAARQIRLRNLSGIIIIDFINTTKENEKILMDILSEEFKKDKLRPMVIDVTALGLVEITRSKREASLLEQIKN